MLFLLSNYEETVGKIRIFEWDHMEGALLAILGNTNPVKLGRCFEFLNNWYGFKHGSTFFQGNQYFEVSEKLFHSPNSNNPYTQKELAESYGITQQTMNNYMKMAIRTLAYDTKEEVMRWMLDIQLGRRNLSPIQRIAVAEKYRPIYEKQAKENLKEGGRKGGLANSSKPSQNSSKASNINNNIDVRAKLAETAGVSTDTYSKGKKILDSDDEELKQEVLSGEKASTLAIKNLHKRRTKKRQVSKNRNE